MPLVVVSYPAMREAAYPAGAAATRALGAPDTLVGGEGAGGLVKRAGQVLAYPSGLSLRFDGGGPYAESQPPGGPAPLPLAAPPTMT